MDFIIDNNLKQLLKKLYDEMDRNGGRISVSSPDYKRTQIDALVNKGLINKIDNGTMEGWGYILSPTYEGESFFSNNEYNLRKKVEELISKGIKIGNEESHISGGPNHYDYVSGPMYDKWMGEINILNERHLKDHPLHASIYTTYIHRNSKPSSYNNMMGHLRALSADEEFLGDSNNIGEGETIMNNTSIAKMMIEDINRCNTFLENPQDENSGIDIYIDITSRYDSIIPNFGNGLYQYIPEQHFYDPEISGETLIFNLKNLKNKMTSYLTLKYPRFSGLEDKKYIIHTSNSEEKHKQISNKVFIVHGHDNEAVQEMARTLEKAGFDAIILHEQADAGLTIMEKIERYSDVDFAVVLYTECDIGRAKDAPANSEKNRARQNVVFEHGYLIGKLGRKQVCALVKGDVETPGDISGVVYVKMDTSGAWKMQLGKNMKEAGLNVDLNKLCI